MVDANRRHWRSVQHVTDGPILRYGAVRLLNVPHAAAVAAEIFDDDCYRFECIPVQSIVLDVGAFYGELAIRCAVEKGCRVIAYEPSSENRTILDANRQLNGVPLPGCDFIVSPCAIGAPGRRSFLYRPEHPAGSMFETEARKHGIAGAGVYVDCVSLGNEIAEARLRWGAHLPVCVKLDCEGAEHEIFESLDWLGLVDVIMMEWHNHDGGHFRDLIAPRGFDVHVEGGGPKPRPAWDPSIGGGLLIATRRGVRA